MGIVDVKPEWSRITNGNTAPLEGSLEKIVLLVTPPNQREGEEDRVYMDLVLVVDISGSMDWGGKLVKVKQTLQGIINGEWQTPEGIKKHKEWLRDLDRLCIITFATTAEVLFPMKTMFPAGNRHEALRKVRDLRADGNTNMKRGLELAVQQIKTHSDPVNHAAAIILLSDGAENIGRATEVPVQRVRVDTIGFGTDHDNKVLQEISTNSDGGTFSNSTNVKQLGNAMSALLEFSKHIVVKDMEVILEQPTTMSVSVDIGSYRKETQPGITKLYLGSLMGGLPIRITLDFYLPPAQTEGMQTVMILKWKCWRFIGVPGHDASPEGGVPIRINRTQGPGRGRRALIVNNVVPKVVRTEEARLNHLSMIKQVRNHADKGEFDQAKEKLAVSMGKLSDLQCLKNTDVSINTINRMYIEGEEIFKVVESEDKYKNCGGQSYVAACISSHERQRYVARGDPGCRVRLFTTDRMNKYLDEATKWDNMAPNA